MNKKINNQFRGREADAQSRQAITQLLEGMPRRRDLLIEFLHRLQDEYHHISADHITALAEELKLSTTEVYEVATFYHHFDVVKDQHPAPPELTVRVCQSITCEMYGAEHLMAELEQQLPRHKVRIQPVPCVGRCHSAPVAVVGTNPAEQATAKKITAMIARGETAVTTLRPYITLDAYRRTAGYQLLKKCHDGDLTRAYVISQMQAAGLRGLGGAGFPAGKKWDILSQQKKPRLIAVNIDEGEPGTFKDRYYLERDPHRLLEGVLIAAWAIEAEAIYMYLRDEYAECRQIMQHELAALANDKTLQTPQIILRRGAGAYICGEESAMIESIEGKRGMPRLRPPFVAEVGLFGKPTLEHNMETLYWVRDILERGPAWFLSHGRNGRQGLRSFSVSGRINRPGVHLAPAGITLNELIAEYCGGMLAGHQLYGYFPGGASGGILPASLADLPLDFDTLHEAGCFIGSAAIIVLSQHDSARQLALNCMRFFAHESCGQCTPCRVGTAKAVKLMQREKWDVALLEELCAAMADASICGLGQAAPNPLRSAINHFPQEFAK